MVEADPTMRAGRNAFGVLLVALIAAYVYRFAQGTDDDLLFSLWVLGAAVYLVSHYWYKRGDG